MPPETTLRIWVKPKASKSVFPLSVSEDLIEASVLSPPDKGKANKELITLISNFFGVSKSQVQIVSGAKSREKIVRIEGVDEQEARKRLFKDR